MPESATVLLDTGADPAVTRVTVIVEEALPPAATDAGFATTVDAAGETIALAAPLAATVKANSGAVSKFLVGTRTLVVAGNRCSTMPAGPEQPRNAAIDILI